MPRRFDWSARWITRTHDELARTLVERDAAGDADRSRARIVGALAVTQEHGLV